MEANTYILDSRIASDSCLQVRNVAWFLGCFSEFNTLVIAGTVGGPLGSCLSLLALMDGFAHNSV
jgi:hypothetical protein